MAIIQTAFLGDVVFTSPLVRVLKRAYPKAHLTFVATPKAATLARCIPGVDAVIAFDKRQADSGFFGLLRVAKAMGRPDVVLAPHPSFRTALLAKLSGAKIRVGHDDLWTRRLYSHTVQSRPREPFVQRYLDLARALHLEGDPELALDPPLAEEQAARALFKGERTLGLVVGSEWATKRWQPESFAALADLCDRAGYQTVLLGAPSEKPIAAAILSAVKRRRPLDAVGNTIPETLGMLSALDGVVGGDSGLLHMSRALGRPTLILFGPTDPGAHNLEPHAQAIRLGIECQPCHPHGPMVCPLGHHDCMRKLTVERVFDALQSVLARAKAS